MFGGVEEKGLTVYQAGSPLWCVAKSQPLWRYWAVIDADVVKQAEP
jgi:hypothetical protein